MIPINPIRFEEIGMCPNCKTNTLYLVQNDLDIMKIEIQGHIGAYKNLKNESFIICSECKEKFDYKKEGFIYKPIIKNRTVKSVDKFSRIFKNPFGVFKRGETNV